MGEKMFVAVVPGGNVFVTKVDLYIDMVCGILGG